MRTLLAFGGLLMMLPAAVQAQRPPLLADTAWTIAAIDGRPVRMERPATVRFSGERIEGRICNSFGGNYGFARGKLTTRQVISTRMACPGEPMRVESGFMRAIAQPLYVHRGRADTLVLSRRGASVTLRRSR